jgi:hypothetical protein
MWRCKGTLPYVGKTGGIKKRRKAVKRKRGKGERANRRYKKEIDKDGK